MEQTYDGSSLGTSALYLKERISLDCKQKEIEINESSPGSKSFVLQISSVDIYSLIKVCFFLTMAWYLPFTQRIQLEVDVTFRLTATVQVSTNAGDGVPNPRGPGPHRY